MAISNARFAQISSRLAREAAAWSADTLDYDANNSASQEEVTRFVQNMRERLDYLAAQSMAPVKPAALSTEAE